MEYTKLTVKHFITDLPNIINKNFENIKNLFDRFIDDSVSGTILLKGQNTVLNGEFSVVKSNTVKAKNFIIIENNKQYTLKEYIEKCIEESNE